MHPAWQRPLHLLLAAFLAGCHGAGAPPTPAALERFTRHVGRITEVEERPDPEGTLVTLTTSTGLEVRALLRALPGPGPFPAAVFADGRELGRHALTYLPGGLDVVVASPDYPDEIPMEIDVGTYVRNVGTIVRAAERIPASFVALGTYLASRPDVDSTRMMLVTSSFAVPFAAIAGAMDPRFRNVAFIYGGADLARLLAANLEVRPALLRRPLATLLTWPLRRLEPARYVAGIAPRHVLIVAGEDDPQIPRASVQLLYHAARQPKQLIWLRTGHVMPWDTELVRALVDTTFHRLPILQGHTPRRAGP